MEIFNNWIFWIAAGFGFMVASMKTKGTRWTFFYAGLCVLCVAVALFVGLPK